MKTVGAVGKKDNRRRIAAWLPIIITISVLLMLSGCSRSEREKSSAAEPQAKASMQPEADEEETAEPETARDPEETVEPSATEETPVEEVPAPTPTSTSVPMFDIIDGRTIMISITEEEFIEYAAFLREALNLNDASIAGILANIQGESGFNPKKVGDSGNAYGICQWRGPRLDQMVQYCKENGLNPITKEGQLQFLAHDLRDNYIYAYDLIRLCEDSEQGALQATYYFCAYYEVPADPEEESAGREELTKLLLYPRLNELSEEG